MGRDLPLMKETYIIQLERAAAKLALTVNENKGTHTNNKQKKEEKKQPSGNRILKCSNEELWKNQIENQ